MSKSVFENEKYYNNHTESVRKGQILSVAADLFSVNGYTVSIDQIAEKLGVTKGHIYYYFKSKQEILYQIFRQGMDFFIQEINENNNHQLPLEERLKVVLKAHILAICENQAVMTVFMDLRKDLNKENWREIVSLRKEYEELIQHLIREGINEGIFINDNEKLLSYTILGSINWVYVWFNETGTLEKEKAADIMAGYLVNGLRKVGNINLIEMGKSVEEISVNDSASFTKTVSEKDVYLYAGISGDYNPIFINEEFARRTGYGKRIVNGGITTSLISPVIGNMLPGVGSIVLKSSCNFREPVYPGDTVTATATVSDIDPENNLVKMELKWVNQNGEEVAVGNITVIPPVKNNIFKKEAGFTDEIG